jgi:hypothetical protein
MHALNRVLCAALALVISGTASWPQQAPFRADQVEVTGLSREQAKQVLIIVLKHEKFRLSMPGVFINADLADNKGNPPHPGFYDYSVGYDSAKAGATEYLGLFSVSRMTGDVWEINICKHYEFPDLRHIQSIIMQRTGQSFAGEKQARLGLGCTDK